MSQGNASAAIGLANTVKIPLIGGYLQKTTPPGPGDEGYHFGVHGTMYWSYNWLQEDIGFLAPSTSGVATGKNAQWVTSGASPITVPADGRMTVTAGTAIAASGTGLTKSFITPATVIPAGSFFWVFDN